MLEKRVKFSQQVEHVMKKSKKKPIFEEAGPFTKLQFVDATPIKAYVDAD